MTPYLLWVLNYDVLREQKKNSGSHRFLKVVFLRCKGEKKGKTKSDTQR